MFCLTCCLSIQPFVHRPVFGTSLGLVKAAHCPTSLSLPFSFLFLLFSCHIPSSISSSPSLSSTTTVFSVFPYNNQTLPCFKYPHYQQGTLIFLSLSLSNKHTKSITNSNLAPCEGSGERGQTEGDFSCFVFSVFFFLVIISFSCSYHEVQWIPAPGPSGGPGDLLHPRDGGPKV